MSTVTPLFSSAWRSGRGSITSATGRAISPSGYGERSVPRTKIVHAIFSRLSAPANLSRNNQIPNLDKYLASSGTRSIQLRGSQGKMRDVKLPNDGRFVGSDDR